MECRSKHYKEYKPKYKQSKNKVKLRKCSAQACFNKLEEYSLNYFPFPEDKKLAYIWAVNADCREILKEPVGIIQNHYLCEQHFEDKYFTNKSKRHFIRNCQPVPTIFNLNHYTRFLKRKLININTSTIDYNPKNDTEILTTASAYMSLADTAFGEINYSDDLYQDIAPNILNIQTDTENTDFFGTRLCRLCATFVPTSSLSSIFNDENYSWYMEKLNICFPGKVEQNDGYPQEICEECTKKLEECSEMILAFSQANLKLQKICLLRNDRTQQTSNDTVNKNLLPTYETETSDVLSNNVDIDQFLESTPAVLPTLPIVKTKDNEENKAKSDLKLQKMSNDKSNTNLLTSESETSDSDNVNTESKKSVCPTLSDEKNKIPEDSETSTIKYKCLLCQKVFETKSDIAKHSLVAHGRKGKIICKIIKEEVASHSKLPTQEKKTEKKLNISELSSDFPEDIRENIDLSSDSDAENTSELINSPIEKEVKESQPDDTLKLNPADATNNESNTIKYQCMSCKILFDSKSEVMKHSAKLHPTPKEGKILCKVVKVIPKNEQTKQSENRKKDIKKNPNSNQPKKPKTKSENKNKVIKSDQNNKQSEEQTNESENTNKSDSEESDTVKYQCLICQELCENRKILVQHTLNKHPTVNKEKITCRMVKVKVSTNKKQLQCSRCKENFNNAYNYLKHMRRHNEKRKNKCSECEMSFENAQKLQNHRRHQHNKKQFFCEGCGEGFTKKTLLQKHEKLLHNKYKFICESCGEGFTVKKLLQKHEKLLHNTGKELICAMCDKKFASKCLFRKHIVLHQPGLCYICGELFPDKFRLKRHMIKHSNGFQCPHCPKFFMKEISFLNHKKIHTINTSVMCQICGKIFRSAAMFNLHRDVHKVKPYKCDICGKAFRKRPHMISHRKTHMDEKPKQVFQCEVCHKEFACKVTLFRHMLIHSELSKYQFECEFCEESFQKEQQLREHCQVHSNDAPYLCRTCDTYFQTQAAFSTHQMKHSKIFHECLECGKKFKRLYALDVHQMDHIVEAAKLTQNENTEENVETDVKT